MKLRLIDTEYSDRLPDMTLAEFEPELPGHEARHEVLAELVNRMGKKSKRDIENYLALFKAIEANSNTHNLTRICRAIGSQPHGWVQRYADSVEVSMSS